MTRFGWMLCILAAVATGAVAQPSTRGAPDPIVIAAMELVKDKCTRDTPCKYKVDRRPAFTVITVEYQRKDPATSELKPGRTELTFERKGALVNRVDSE